MKDLIMTLRDVADPSKWSEGWRWLVGGLVFAVLSVIGTAGTTGILVGSYREQFTQFGNKLNQVIAEQRSVKDALSKEHDDATAAARAATDVAKDLAEGRARTLPRIDKLEEAVSQIQPDLSAIKEHVRNTDITTARHDAAISHIDEKTDAILEAVRPSPYPHGH